MKSFFAIALLASLAVAYAQPTTTEQAVEDPVSEPQDHYELCREESGVPEDALKALKTGNFENVEPCAKDYVNCVMEHSDMLVDGVLQEDVVTAKMNPLFGEDQVSAAIQDCKHIADEFDSDAGFKLYQCFMHRQIVLM